MKFTNDHLTWLARAIGDFDTASGRWRYLTGRFPNADRVQDLDKRYRWDCFWAAHRANPDLAAALSEANYLDAHIDTALRHIVRPLGSLSEGVNQ